MIPCLPFTSRYLRNRDKLAIWGEEGVFRYRSLQRGESIADRDGKAASAPTATTPPCFIFAKPLEAGPPTISIRRAAMMPQQRLRAGCCLGLELTPSLTLYDLSRIAVRSPLYDSSSSSLKSRDRSPPIPPRLGTRG